MPLGAGSLWVCCVCHSVAAACHCTKASLATSRRLQSSFCAFWVPINDTKAFIQILSLICAQAFPFTSRHTDCTRFCCLAEEGFPLLGTAPLFLPLRKALCFGSEGLVISSEEHVCCFHGQAYAVDGGCLLCSHLGWCRCWLK